MIVKTINSFNQFSDEFQAFGRGNQFTQDGLRVIYDYLEQYSAETDTDYHLDVIAICCDFSELDAQSLRENYGLGLDKFADEQELIQYLIEKTEYCGQATNGNFVFSQF